MIIKKKIKIRNPQGLHARPASLFVRIANRFEADLQVKKGRESVNGKSIMGILMLAASQGSVVQLEASGVDAESMMRELENFLLLEDESQYPGAGKEEPRPGSERSL